MLKKRVHLPEHKIAEFCKENHIRKLSLFGSFLRGDFKPDSDMDFLVEFDPKRIPGLFDMARMERELSKIVGRNADLRTAQDLSRYFREEVVNSAEVVCARE